MTELDTVFAAMRERPMPHALGAIDAPVLAGLARLRERQTALRSLSLACVVAGMVWLWAGGGTPTPGSRDVEALLGVPASAPSSLLVD